MDPNENLREQRILADRIMRCRARELPVDEDDVERLASLVAALDEWITRGGFLPQAWRNNE